MRVVFRCDPALIDRLPRPIPARQGLPDWLRTMPAAAFSETHGAEVRTVKHCPPFVDAMTHGFLMTLPCDVTVAEGRLSWAWDLPPLGPARHPRSPLSFHVAEQVVGTPFRPESGTGTATTGAGTAGPGTIVKFNSFWTIELEPGHSLLATHPLNRPDLPFRTLSGLVDADRFSAVGILFPAVWTDPGFEGVLPAGTPVAQCMPVLRDGLDLGFEPFGPEAALAYDETADALLGETGVYRRRYRASRDRASPDGTSRDGTSGGASRAPSSSR